MKKPQKDVLANRRPRMIIIFVDNVIYDFLIEANFK